MRHHLVVTVSTDDGVDPESVMRRTRATVAGTIDVMGALIERVSLAGWPAKLLGYDPLTRADIDPVACGGPGCDHTAQDVPMSPTCIEHIGGPQQVFYVHGRIEVTCWECGDLISTISVEP